MLEDQFASKRDPQRVRAGLDPNHVDAHPTSKRLAVARNFLLCSQEHTHRGICRPRTLEYRAPTRYTSHRETVATRFEVGFAEGKESFSLVWPLEMGASLIPVFDGRKRERDPATDTRWQKAIRARLPDAVMSLTATVGHAEKQLGELTGLKPGDVIGIDNPRAAWLEAGNRAVLGSRFGVHAGRNAIEITGWMEPDTTT
jgi:flagellar motor switch protein FliM